MAPSSNKRELIEKYTAYKNFLESYFPDNRKTKYYILLYETLINVLSEE